MKHYSLKTRQELRRKKGQPARDSDLARKQSVLGACVRVFGPDNRMTTSTYVRAHKHKHKHYAYIKMLFIIKLASPWLVPCQQTGSSSHMMMILQCVCLFVFLCVWDRERGPQMVQGKLRELRSPIHLLWLWTYHFRHTVTHTFTKNTNICIGTL